MITDYKNGTGFKVVKTPLSRVESRLSSMKKKNVKLAFVAGCRKSYRDGTTRVILLRQRQIQILFNKNAYSPPHAKNHSLDHFEEPNDSSRIHLEYHALNIKACTPRRAVDRISRHKRRYCVFRATLKNSPNIGYYARLFCVGKRFE